MATPPNVKSDTLNWRNRLLNYLSDIMGLTKTYTTATMPAAADNPGKIIFVSDGGSGQEFKGSNGTSWVDLG